MSVRIAAFALAFAIFAPLRARADVILPPPNVILPNYDRTLVGKSSALEAGAYAARVNDSSSSWYNPAGLMHAKGTQVDATSSAYQWTGVTLESAGISSGSVSGGSPPSFFGIVFGPPLFDGERMRAAVSLANEVYWAPTLQSEILRTNQAGDNLRLFYSTRDNFSETIPALSVAFARSEALRLGFSLAGDVVTFQANDSSSNQTTNATSQAIFSRSGQLYANAVNLFVSAGAQYDLSDRWKLALVASTPSLRLWGSSRVTLENIATSGSTVTDVAFYEPDGDFKFTRAWQASLGVAYAAPSFELEADLKYHGAIGPFTAFSSGQSVVTTTSSGGAPTTTTSSFNDVTNQFRSLVNFAIGGKYALSDKFELHGGFFTSLSPIPDVGSAIFRKVDLHGFTLGALLKIEQFSASLGAAYEVGSSDPYSIPTSVTGDSLTATVNVSSLSILYALSYSF